MPIYEYRCEACSHEFEELVFNSKTVPVCPKCNSQNVVRLMSCCCITSNDGQADFGTSAPSTGGGGGCGGCAGGNCATCGH